MPTSTVPGEAREAILAWFARQGRSFPFRGLDDPYAILVSETMAQQTQIERASRSWARFMARFPTVHALAAAAPADVLREWRGLGYNRRAVNLWRAARAIVDEHGGRVPADLAALERLPGVGAYTARAVAAFAFGRPVGPVDTNVRRVLGRLVSGTDATPARRLQPVADAVVPTDRPGDWTYALMDIGATLCRPINPDCGSCPVEPWCRFGRRGLIRPAVAGAARRRQAAFPETSRWLRGRLVDRLRDAVDDGWVEIRGPFGTHGPVAIEAALAAMALDGLVERHPADASLARLPGSANGPINTG